MKRTKWYLDGNPSRCFTQSKQEHIPKGRGNSIMTHVDRKAETTVRINRCEIKTRNNIVVDIVVEQERRTARTGVQCEGWLWNQRCELKGLDGWEQRGSEDKEHDDEVEPWHQFFFIAADRNRVNIDIRWLWISHFPHFRAKKGNFCRI